MAHAAEDLIQMLYEMVQESFALPFGNDKCILDRDKVLGLLDEIKGTLPQEIKQARNIVTERNNVLASAQREAEIIKRNAEEMGRRLVSEQEVLTVATKKANDKLAEAETRAREVRRATNEYVDNALKRTEDAMAQALNEVRQSRSEFRQAIAKPAPKDKHKG